MLLQAAHERLRPSSDDVQRGPDLVREPGGQTAQARQVLRLAQARLHRAALLLLRDEGALGGFEPLTHPVELLGETAQLVAVAHGHARVQRAASHLPKAPQQVLDGTRHDPAGAEVHDRAGRDDHRNRQDRDPVAQRARVLVEERLELEHLHDAEELAARSRQGREQVDDGGPFDFVMGAHRDAPAQRLLERILADRGFPFIPDDS
jgi:hypothetical protein